MPPRSHEHDQDSQAQWAAIEALRNALQAQALETARQGERFLSLERLATERLDMLEHNQQASDEEAKSMAESMMIEIKSNGREFATMTQTIAGYKGYADGIIRTMAVRWAIGTFVVAPVIAAVTVKFLK